MNIQPTNPISQRIEILGEKWNDASFQPEARIIRLLPKEDEIEMCEAFFEYMLSTEANVDDIPILFNTRFSMKTYSEKLLKELEELIRMWNETPKRGDFPMQNIEWQADYSLTEKGNPAALFIANINELARTLVKDKGVFLSPILKLYSSDTDGICDWLKSAIKFGISEYIRIGIIDFEKAPLFNRLSSCFPEKIITVTPELDMPQALIQLASMGDPEDPAVGYRRAFIKMMEAIGKRCEPEVQKQANECLNIASANIPLNPYWIGQEVAVHTALANNAIGHKKWKDALSYSEKAIQCALKAKDSLDKGISARMTGQSYMLNGTMLLMDKQSGKAIDSFRLAGINYSNCEDTIMQIESLRMCASACKKNGNSDEELDLLIEGFRLGEKLSPEFIIGSSYPLLVKRLLKKSYQSKLATKELDDFFIPKLGKDWQDIIQNYGTVNEFKKLIN